MYHSKIFSRSANQVFPFTSYWSWNIVFTVSAVWLRYLQWSVVIENGNCFKLLKIWKWIFCIEHSYSTFSTNELYAITSWDSYHASFACKSAIILNREVQNEPIEEVKVHKNAKLVVYVTEYRFHSMFLPKKRTIDWKRYWRNTKFQTSSQVKCTKNAFHRKKAVFVPFMMRYQYTLYMEHSTWYNITFPKYLRRTRQKQLKWRRRVS